MPQNLNLSLRSRATPKEILESFRDRLREACPGCNDLTCFISDQAIPKIIPGGEACITISPGGGSFDQQLFSAGGHQNLTEDMQVIVSALIRINLDRIPQAERALFATDRGLMSVWKRNILRALLLADSGEDISVNSLPWEPASGNRPLCRNQIRPLNCTAPADVSEHPEWIGFHLTFSVEFDWDLYSNG